MPSKPSPRLAADDPVRLTAEIERGLPVSELKRFHERSELPLELLAYAIHVPVRTLRRRFAQDRLPVDESDRLYRFSSLFQKLLDLFEGDAPAVQKWLQSPAPAFSGRTPLSLARTSPGSRAVEDLIGQLEHGVFP